MHGGAIAAARNRREPKEHYLDRTVQFNNRTSDTVSRVRALGAYVVFITVLTIALIIIDIGDINNVITLKNDLEQKFID